MLCEKPVAVSLADAARLVEQVRASSLVLQVGFKNRFSPLVLALRRLIEDGRLGEPLLIRIGAFDEAYRPADGLHTERIRGFLARGAPVVHEGGHWADLLNWLLGPPVAVSATAHRSQAVVPGARTTTVLRSSTRTGRSPSSRSAGGSRTSSPARCRSTVPAAPSS